MNISIGKKADMTSNEFGVNVKSTPKTYGGYFPQFQPNGGNDIASIALMPMIINTSACSEENPELHRYKII